MKPNGILKAGLIVTIVFASLNILQSLSGMAFGSFVIREDGGIIAMLTTGTLGVFISILAIIFSAKALKDERFRIAAGVFGILSNIVGGILTLIGHYESDK